MSAQATLRNELQDRLDSYRVRNPAFSLRAFAQKLGISPATLSRILTGKRGASKKLAEQFAEKLCLSPQKKDEILALFPATRSYKSDESVSNQSLQLTMDQFKVVSEWYHFALRALLKTEDANDSPQWLAKRLGISKTQAASALERLNRLGLIERDRQGRFVATSLSYFSPDGTPSGTIRKNHAQHLELALDSLEQDEVTIRDFTNLTFAIDPDKLTDARKLIRKFRQQMTKLMEPGPKKEVYSLCVQLFPLSENENENN